MFSTGKGYEVTAGNSHWCFDDAKTKINAPSIIYSGCPSTTITDYYPPKNGFRAIIQKIIAYYRLSDFGCAKKVLPTMKSLDKDTQK